tara:strand:- start:547 stop:1152 length:606 start_codon:yes stop_codon:yes gene_type:complete
MKLQDLLKDIEQGKVYTDKDRKPFKVNEDGHTDVPSAIRKLKLSIEDSQQILQKLKSMNQEDSLPSWWTDKITLASNYLNKSRDYLLKGGKVKEGFGGVSSPPPFSSPEAKKVVDDALRSYSKDLRKLQGRVVKDWMSKAKSGVIDFFDLVRGFQTGDMSRAYPYETEFLQKVLTKDKIVDRFRKYFGGKKALNNRTTKKR